MRVRASGLAIVLLQLGAGFALAQEGEAPVEVRVESLFGDELLFPNGHAEVVVILANRSRADFSGDVRVEIQDWQQPDEVYRVRVDLPARAERRVQVPVYLRQNGTQVRAVYEAAGRRFRSLPLTVGFNGAAEGIVVLADPPRVRSALLDLTDEQAEPGTTYVRSVEVPVGVVATDADTGDFLAPTSVVGWRGVKLLVASAPDLERLTPPQQAVLRDWLRVGGDLLVFPRTPEDLRGPLLRSLVGEVQWAEGPAVAVPGYEVAVPPEAQGRSFSLGANSAGRLEAFGASFPVGFGRVFLASYDGASEPFTDAIETRRTAASILRRARRPGEDRPLFTFGGADDSSLEWLGGMQSFRILRSALDPNESFRPALVLVALVLLVYVLLVGPINFSYVTKKNRPLLVLLTTPAAAAACLLVLLLVGYVGKGATLRYRAASLLELVEGEAEGPRRSYLGLFLARPTTFDLPAAPRGVTRLLFEGGTHRPVVRREGDAVSLVGLQGALWETLFVREETLQSLGGAVAFDRSDRNLTRVRNESGTPLEGAVVVDGVGGVYPVGDIPAGGSAAIAGSPTLSLRADNPTFYGPQDPHLVGMAEAMGLGPEARPALRGLVQAAGGAMVTGLPTLWARLPSTGEEVAGRFGPESELHLVRIVPRVPGAPVSTRWGGAPAGQEGVR